MPKPVSAWSRCYATAKEGEGSPTSYPVDHDRDLYDFAVHLLAEMLETLKAGYYAKGFEP